MWKTKKRIIILPTDVSNKITGLTEVQLLEMAIAASLLTEQQWHTAACSSICPLFSLQAKRLHRDTNILWWCSFCDELCYAGICPRFQIIGSFKSYRREKLKGGLAVDEHRPELCPCENLGLFLCALKKAYIAGFLLDPRPKHRAGLGLLKA
ncbi:unnamed protein product [Dovyalis caffra]|uniref:Uncharacterized protein n=1 Tax=Dovyalis caffra TaxID=77055 RepID=A0AAV1SUL7_9ROSI|nr:unnamed protein product [Dovyalis caffra]